MPCRRWAADRTPAPGSSPHRSPWSRRRRAPWRPPAPGKRPAGHQDRSARKRRWRALADDVKPAKAVDKPRIGVRFARQRRDHGRELAHERPAARARPTNSSNSATSAWPYRPAPCRPGPCGRSSARGPRHRCTAACDRRIRTRRRHQLAHRRPAIGRARFTPW